MLKRFGFFSKKVQKQNVKTQMKQKKKNHKQTKTQNIFWYTVPAKILKQKTQAHIFVGDAKQILIHI